MTSSFSVGKTDAASRCKISCTAVQYDWEDSLLHRNRENGNSSIDGKKPASKYIAMIVVKPASKCITMIVVKTSLKVYNHDRSETSFKVYNHDRSETRLKVYNHDRSETSLKTI